MPMSIVVRLAAIANSCCMDRAGSGEARHARTVWDDLWLAAYELHREDSIKWPLAWYWMK
jgi:hypothetical protein